MLPGRAICSETSSQMSLGLDSAPRLLPVVLVPLPFLCREICWHFCWRFGEASLLTQEKFDIPFLQKNVLPGSGPYSGFLSWNSVWLPHRETC